ncbi:RNA 2',3'-cyclic phosphodiesterase [Paraburkholderia sp.]|uniref:RNA 2',3'-cyclic phosphodiesterase n=1 Tax=Paraburkholderia sp. TaxID=1926495 RepID=UPI002382904E|nr:RNA 2',3'-cyclic phosphodiesterase [Paraburkholderia sp.]MDE1180697.1 RNA 2',3'-cyclic phosphodiesterase [Paraburkholderia sp.]
MNAERWQRCFIALSPDSPTRERLAALPVPQAARRVPSAQLHLTVAFIGELSAAGADALAGALSAVPVPHVPPTHIERVEHWPNPARPRLTVALLPMSDAFVALDGRVRSALLALGLPVDARAFRPHLTFARYRRASASVAVETAITPDPPTPVRFNSLVLYASTLTRQGARYQPLFTVPFT